jgi:NAD(P)-dependent dehydrogenase (short-subunit alcohol dehydrogenase family)
MAGMRSQGRCAIHKGETGMISFAGRVAIVTGGSSGIGEATVRKLSALGANVLIADVDAARGQEIAAQLSASGVRADLVVTDILVEEQIVALVDRTVRYSPHHCA